MKQRLGILISKAQTDTRGQDLVEYVLMAGIVAVMAGALIPSTASNIGAIFSRVGSVMTSAESPSGETLELQQPSVAPCGADRSLELPDGPIPGCG
jgi:Flp pilus assembly pilin Flp